MVYHLQELTESTLLGIQWNLHIKDTLGLGIGPRHDRITSINTVQWNLHYKGHIIGTRNFVRGCLLFGGPKYIVKIHVRSSSFGTIKPVLYMEVFLLCPLYRVVSIKRGSTVANTIIIPLQSPYKRPTRTCDNV